MNFPTIGNVPEIINIDNIADTVVARMRVRELARELNLDITSQACISIAVTSLAQEIRLGTDHHGRVEVSSFSSQLRKGIRVDLVITGIGCQQYESAIQGQTFTHLLDEIFIKSMSDLELIVTAVKWTGSYTGPYM